MISRKIMLFTAAVSMVALATTVGLAGAIHTYATSAQKTQGSGSKAVGPPSDQNNSPRHGILTCGSNSAATACEQLEMMLPMSEIIWAEPLKLLTDI